QIRVRDAMRPLAEEETIRDDVPLREMLDRIRSRPIGAVPVLDSEGSLVGLLTLDAVRRALLDPATIAGKSVRDVAATGFRPITRNDDLRAALQAFLENETDVLPVVDGDRPSRIAGTLARGDVLLAYDHEIRRRRESDGDRPRG